MSTQPTSVSPGQAQSGPADELLDPQRPKLITRLIERLGISHVTSVAWACLWLADLSKIELFIDSCERGGRGAVTAQLRSPTLSSMIKAWQTRSRNTPNVAASRVTNSMKCLARDKETCLLTEFGDALEVAHIFPYSLGNWAPTELAEFWNYLESFWSLEKVNTWKEEVLGPDGTETCQNLMCMVNLAHKLWENARFALKPLALTEDNKVLTVQFHWLPRNVFCRNKSATEVPSPFAPDLSSSTADNRDFAALYNITTKTTICSGDILTFTTDDPVNKPLPSFELLDMQWYLHRVLALSGAADATDEELDPDSDMSMELASFDSDSEDTEEDTEKNVEEN